MTVSDVNYSRLPQLRAATSLLLAIAQEGSDRLTVSQAAFFLFAAKAQAVGKPATRSQLLQASGSDFRPSTRNSYRQLLEPSRVYPNALGWLLTEENPNDAREKILTLSEDGEKVIEGALNAQANSIFES